MSRRTSKQSVLKRYDVMTKDGSGHWRKTGESPTPLSQSGEVKSVPRYLKTVSRKGSS